MTILIQLLLLFLCFFGKMEIKFLVYYPIWTLIWKKKYETVELAKSTSWPDIIVKCYQILEAWGKILDENPINQADKPSIMDVALILGSNLVLNNPINQADKPNIIEVALILGTKKDNEASVKSRDVSLKVSGFSLSLPESPGFAPILT